MKFSKKITIIYGLLIFLSTFVAAEEISTPKRIISLGTTVTENLYILEVGSNLIANTVYCQRPPDAANKEKIGSVTKVDMEKILRLKPDLVLATSLTNERQVAKLKNMGLNVEVFPQIQNFEHFCDSFIELGRAVGKKQKAVGIIKKLKSEVEDVRRRREGKKRPSVFIQLGAKPLFAATKEFIVHDMVSIAGGINIAADAGNGAYSRERVLAADPDIILIVTMGIVGEKEKELWESHPVLSAVKNNRIHIVDSYKVCSPTPETFVETLQGLCEYFDFYEKADGQDAR